MTALLWALLAAGWTVLVYKVGRGASDMDLILRLAHAEHQLDVAEQCINDCVCGHDSIALTAEERDAWLAIDRAWHERGLS